MDKVYLLITGEKIQAFWSLKKLSEEIGVEVKKENLPFKSGRFRIEVVKVGD
jgi:hypothetical protein